MAANTGRTVSKYVNFVIADSGNTIRDIPISSISVCGVVYDEIDVMAFQDAVKSALPGHPDAPIDITGPFDTTAAQAASGTGVAPALSGSHTVLSPLNGAYTPRSVDIQFGIRQTWETGEPQFGITATSTSWRCPTSPRSATARRKSSSGTLPRITRRYRFPTGHGQKKSPSRGLHSTSSSTPACSTSTRSCPTSRAVSSPNPRKRSTSTRTTSRSSREELDRPVNKQGTNHSIKH